MKPNYPKYKYYRKVSDNKIQRNIVKIKER